MGLALCSAWHFKAASPSCQRLWLHLWDKYWWLILLVSFNNGRFSFLYMCQFLILTARKDGADVEEGFLLAGDPMGSFNVFDYFFLWEMLHIFLILFASTIFVSSHAFSDCCFLMFLKTSVFLSLLFLRSSTSTGGSTEKIWVHRFSWGKKTNISKVWKFNLAVWVNVTVRTTIKQHNKRHTSF